MVEIYPVFEFGLEKDAEAYGLQMAEIWIDGHLPGEVNFG